jgi:methylenetetrahydrofolate dehydrogenase (NADP+)/methenyltetrahydrofolate cyclohydrolase
MEASLSMAENTQETIIVNGLELAQGIRSKLAKEVEELAAQGRRAPCLAVVLVGDDPASASYIKGKQRACAKVGMGATERMLPASSSEAEIIAVVEELNNDDEIDGILVQLPLPKGISANNVAAAIDPAKDVDALHPSTAGKLLLGNPTLAACTPLGSMYILEHFDIEMEGANAVVIGRSNIVGKPISLMLQQKNATVTMCHSRTRDLQAICRQADILVAAVGVPKLVKPAWIKPGAAVIDIGVTNIDGKLVGDVDTEGAVGIASIITPHRRGVGPMTITMLLVNTMTAYRSRTGA